MKTKFYLAVIPMALAACSRSSEEVRQGFSGENWKQTKEVIYDGKTGAVMETLNEGCGELLEFKNTQNYRVTEYDEHTCIKGNVWEGNYSYNSNTKIITIDNEEYTVKSKTSSEMQLGDEYYDRNGDGTPEKQVLFYARK